MEWDEYFLRMVEAVALKSKDRSSKVGCVIVGPAKEVRSTGFNGFPRGCQDDIDERHERPIKYSWTEHADRNAIFNAARHGTPLEGCTMYLNGPPCAECARAIIQAGIKEVIYPRDNFLSQRKDWEESVNLAGLMMLEAGVAVIQKTIGE